MGCVPLVKSRVLVSQRPKGKKKYPGPPFYCYLENIVCVNVKWSKNLNLQLFNNNFLQIFLSKKLNKFFKRASSVLVYKYKNVQNWKIWNFVYLQQSPKTT